MTRMHSRVDYIKSILIIKLDIPEVLCEHSDSSEVEGLMFNIKQQTIYDSKNISKTSFTWTQITQICQYIVYL